MTVTHPAQAPLADSVLEALREFDTPTIAYAAKSTICARRHVTTDPDAQSATAGCPPGK